MTIPAYPLAWPNGWPRTPLSGKADAAFRSTNHSATGSFKRSLTISDGVERVLKSLQLMGVDDGDRVISTNVKTRLDGWPRSAQAEPSDTGVAVYWEQQSGRRCMAIDKYFRVADNLAAIAATLEALRSIERYGGAQILDRAFTGFTALPGPGLQHWSFVFDIDYSASVEEVTAAYKRLRSKHHPDNGGSTDEFNRIEHAFKHFKLDRHL